MLALMLFAAALAQERPASFCYGTIGPNIQASLQLHNPDPHAKVRVLIRVQTLAGTPLAPPVDRELAPGADYETVFPPAEQLQHIWAVLSTRPGARLEGSMVTEKTLGVEVKTRTSTLTEIFVQDPRARPRGAEPNQAVHRLGSFFTGEFAFIGNPRDRQLDVSFCGVRTRKCWQFGLPPFAAISVSLIEFQASLGISSPQDLVALEFANATAFLNMRNAGADSAITFNP